MHLNPHGDQAIYDTMVRLARGNESLLVPYVDSKGNFGKAYSRDMAYAASRYTEAKLDPICRGAVLGHRQGDRGLCAQLRRLHHRADTAAGDLPDDSRQQHPGHRGRHGQQYLFLQSDRNCATTTIALMKDPSQADLSTLMPAPDFVGGGYILYNAAELQNVYDTGRGSIRVRAKWTLRQGKQLH